MKLKDLLFSSNLETINHGAFSSCTRLETVSLPGTISFIGYGAFYDSGLTKATLGICTGWYILGTGYMNSPAQIENLRDPALVASRLRTRNGEYWQRK